MWPRQWGFRAWDYVFGTAGFQIITALVQSMLVALVTALISVAIGLPAGRALGLYDFKGKDLISVILTLPVIVLPLCVAMGLHLWFIKMGLASTFLGVVLVHLTFCLPYSVFVLWGVFSNYNPDFEGQAHSLGASSWKVISRVMLPLTSPGIMVAGLFSFLLSWSQYLSTLIIGGSRVTTLPILLLDEPLSNLDANLRQQMRELIQDIQAETRITTLFVTHDQAEALMISHRVGLLLNGRLRQTGKPRELFYQPGDPEVARFFGGCNFIQGRVKNGVFRSEFGNVSVPEVNGNGHLRTATIRPEDILLSLDAKYDLHGKIAKTNFEGSATRIWVKCKDTHLVVLTSDNDFKPGQSVRIHLPPDKIRIFPVEPESV